MTMDARCVCPSTALLVVTIAFGCRDAPLSENVNSNTTPIAHAGAMQVLEYDGSPIAIRLDGSGSADPDGTVVSYRWLSGTAATGGGLGRVGPDPQDVVSPTVTLDAGLWIFTLFVTDDEGGVSQPSAVMIRVGSDASPAAMACSGASLPTIAEDCRLCACDVGDECRTAMMACDQPCWDFYTCVQNECGEFSGDMMGLANCVRASCATFFSGVGKYMPLEPCVNMPPCGPICSASVLGM